MCVLGEAFFVGAFLVSEFFDLLRYRFPVGCCYRVHGITRTESAACQGSPYPTALQDVRARPKGGVMPNKKSAWQVGPIGFAVVFKAVVPYFEPTGAVLLALAVMAILRHIG